MKLITLNTWGGKIAGPLLEFVRTHAAADIFCFQEMYHGARGKEKDYDKDYHELFSAIAELLPDHRGHFHPHYGDYYGLALFHRKELVLDSFKEVFVHRTKEEAALLEPGLHPRNIQIASFGGYRPFAAANFHGLWNGKDKDDSPDRLAQSERILAAIKDIKKPLVICGDFNLNPRTESVRLFERRGLRNLITEYGVTDTRTRHYAKTYSRFADYIFTSPGVEVKGFRVLPEEVSDHAALELEFEIEAGKP